MHQIGIIFSDLRQYLAVFYLFLQVKLRRIIGTQFAAFKERTRIVEATREGISVFSVNSVWFYLSVLFALFYLRKFTKEPPCA